MKNNMPTTHQPYPAYWAIALPSLLLTGILYYFGAPYFQPFFGSFPPLLVVAGAGLLGYGLLSLFLSRGWFAIYKKTKGLLTAISLALPFAAAIILVDLLAVFPEDINVPLPEALLFYPAIAFVVEVVFHLLPLGLLLLMSFSYISFDKAIVPVIVIVALLEPLFQLSFGFPDTFPRWAQAYTGLHIYLINLVQLYLFRHYDFVAMYGFRFGYYLLWHVAWGYVRLEVLF